LKPEAKIVLIAVSAAVMTTVQAAVGIACYEFRAPKIRSLVVSLFSR